MERSWCERTNWYIFMNISAVMKKKKSGKNFFGKEKEPATTYGKSKKLSQVFKTITISSLAEQEEEMRAYSSGLSPLERLAYLYKLNQIAFAHVLNDPDQKLWDKKIHIDKANGGIY